jgi:hypothetical protein
VVPVRAWQNYHCIVRVETLEAHRAGIVVGAATFCPVRANCLVVQGILQVLAAAVAAVVHLPILPVDDVRDSLFDEHLQKLPKRRTDLNPVAGSGFVDPQVHMVPVIYHRDDPPSAWWAGR